MTRASSHTSATSHKTALVTGAAGFIGYHCCQALLAQGLRVVGLDVMSTYYDVSLKQDRLAQLAGDFRFVEGAVETPGLLLDLFAEETFDVVIHLAAQAGVRYSIDNPRAYLDSNIAGTFELLEAARAHPPAHMLLASSSSAYGANTQMPYAECAPSDHPLSFYAATKKAGEAMAHSYAHLYDLPITLFRFFTVYGPWGRPDMALFKFTKAILAGEAIDVYNHGDMSRDFTYIDDLVAGIVALIDAVPVAGERAHASDSLSPAASWRIVNLGNSKPVQLTEFITAIEAATGKVAIQNLLPMQAGDLPATWADTTLLEALTGERQHTDLRSGVARFVAWYCSYYS
ncbi:NAD-dependent epimerase/dehydratase family protein [Epibacterium ulvae]|uniref:NAD-dependent epimerase/dehydratase family protein n=1 Tax=Epibacterium ulvae TaxID=1156985 RepID=UPI001BFC98E5|nr:NAD-dependent epimerase/dehydratase family protein [Epibacterium ulvae]MBT8154542.1 NAD-dependent epimerase/dehydratase family protein [Epibacterium ulvae]